MACIASYLYEQVFFQYGEALKDILLNDEDPYRPFPLYETREAYDADTTSDFKGILVWNAQRYYTGLSDDPSNYDEYCNDVGFFVVPQFGAVRIIPNVEFKQFITISFDFSSEPDKDPYGAKAVKFVHWFINRQHTLLEKVTAGLLPKGIPEQLLPNGLEHKVITVEEELDEDGVVIVAEESTTDFKPLWSMMDGISDPIYSNSIYIRRNVTEIVRYCRCS